MPIENKADQNYFFKKLFFPIAALLALAGISSILFNSATKFFLYNNFSEPKLLATTISRASGLVLSFICTIAFLVIVSKRSIRSWLSPLLICFIGGQIALSFLPASEIKTELNAEPNFNSYLSLINEAFTTNWYGTFVFFLIGLLKPSIFLILIWGFANQITRLAEGMKYYIFLALVAGVSLVPFTLLGQAASLVQTRFFLVGSILCLSLAWLLFRSLCKKIPDERWEEEPGTPIEPSRTSYIFIFGLAFGAFRLMKSLLSYFIKLLPKEQTPTWIAEYPLITGIGVLTLTIPCLFLGYWLLKKKGWLLTVLTPALIVSQSIALSYVFYLAHLFAAEMLVFNEILLTTFSTAFLFPVLQIGYLSLPKANRFHTKAWAEIVFTPIVIGSGSLIVQQLLIAFGSLQAVSPLLPPISIVVAIGMSLSLGIIGKRKAFSTLPTPAQRL